MNWNEIYNRLTETERLELMPQMIMRIERSRFPYNLRNLRPAHLLVPAALAQIALFISITLLQMENLFIVLMTGNLVIVALAVLPSVWSRPRLVVHWIR